MGRRKRMAALSINKRNIEIIIYAKMSDNAKISESIKSYKEVKLIVLSFFVTLDTV